MRTISARFTSNCHECGKPVEKDSEAIFDDDTRWIFHPACAPDQEGSSKTGQFSASTDGYRAPKKPEELADELGFGKPGESA